MDTEIYNKLDFLENYYRLRRKSKLLSFQSINRILFLKSRVKEMQNSMQMALE